MVALMKESETGFILVWKEFVVGAAGQQLEIISIS
jgi:hypothetical protein